MASFIRPASAVAMDWTYQVRPGDTLWDLGTRFLESPDQWRQLQNLNRIADPARLVPGSQVRIPVEWLRVKPAPARIVAVHGDVRISDVGQVSGRAASDGDNIVSGGRIQTAKDATATIEFADGSRLLVQSDTELLMDTLSTFGETGMVDTRMRLQRGRVESQVKPNRGPAGNFIIETAPATTTVRGTEFRVFTAGSEFRTITEVVSGEVQVQRPSGSFVVRPLQALVLSDAAEAPPIIDLLPAPDLAVLPDRPLKPGEHLAWPAIVGASGYRVRLVHAQIERVVADTVVDGPAATLALVDNGDYRLQVRAIDSHDIEGVDATRPISVLGTPEPPFAVEPQPGAVLPPASIQFRWTEPVVAKAYRLQIASDPQFSTLVAEQDRLQRARFSLRSALPIGQYYWRLASIDGEGRVGPYSDAESFEIRERSAAPDADSIGREKASIRWRGGSDGQRYQVQVARDPDYTTIAFDEVVDEPRLDTERIGNGRWYLRVRLIDPDGFEGQFSDSQYLRIGCTLCRVGAGLAGAALLLLL